MMPTEIIKGEFGNSKNFITENIYAIGSVPFGAYELSYGSSPVRPQHTIWGVSVVALLKPAPPRWRRTDRLLKASHCFQTRNEADEWIDWLKKCQSAEEAEAEGKRRWST